VEYVYVAGFLEGTDIDPEKSSIDPCGLMLFAWTCAFWMILLLALME